MKKRIGIFLLCAVWMLSYVTVTAKEDIFEDLDELQKMAYEQEASYAKMRLINRNDNKIIERNEYDFSDKKITCLGDSITYGTGGSEDEDGNRISYCKFLAEKLGCEVVNMGVGGTPIAQYDLYKEYMLGKWRKVPRDSDIILVFGGLNDYFSGESFGSLDELKSMTYCGDVNRLMKNLKIRCPDADIFFVISHKNESESWEIFEDHPSFKKYMNVQRKLAKENGIEIIEIYNTGLLDSHNADIKDKLVPDGIHPNDEGSEILGDHIAACLAEYYTKKQIAEEEAKEEADDDERDEDEKSGDEDDDDDNESEDDEDEESEDTEDDKSDEDDE